MLLWGAGAAAGETRVVNIEGMRYQPASLTVRPGDRIVWRNLDLVPHTVTQAGFDSGRIDPGASWSLEVREPGRHSYRCTLHPGMRAAFIGR